MSSASVGSSPGYLYARAWVTTFPNGERVPMIKIGRAQDMRRREPGYRRWEREYPSLETKPIYCVVRVDDAVTAERLLREHFREHNVEHEFGTIARQAMSSPEFAKFAEVFGDGRECLRGVSVQEVKEFMLQLGELVTA